MTIVVTVQSSAKFTEVKYTLKGKKKKERKKKPQSCSYLN